MENIISKTTETILSRFNQTNQIHHFLRNFFFSDPGKRRILRCVHSEHCKVYTINGTGFDEHDPRHYTSFPQTIADLDQIVVRFASLAIIPGQQIEVHLIPTTPIDGIYCCDLYGLLETLEKGGFDTLQNEFLQLIEILAEKAIQEILICKTPERSSPGFMDQYDGSKCMVVSMDAYYNRARDKAGLFHRDTSVGFGNDPDFISIEYFMGAETVLGPEIIPNTPGSLIEKVRATPDLQVDTSLRSLRVLVENSSVCIMNNQSLIHATPVLSEDYTFLDGSQGNIFRGVTYPRLEAVVPEHQIVSDTRTIRRSFVRSFICDMPTAVLTSMPHLQIPTEIVNEIMTRVNHMISSTPFRDTNNSDLYGGRRPSFPAFKITGDPNLFQIINLPLKVKKSARKTKRKK